MKIVTMEEFDEITATGVVLVDFFATWCGPCKMIAPVLEELAETYKDQATIIKVDVDQQQELAQRYGVMSIPTLILFKNGKDIKTVSGFQPKPMLENLIKSAL